MKLTKSEILFILYVILTVVNSFSSMFNDNYQTKFNAILDKMAVIVDEAKD